MLQVHLRWLLGLLLLQFLRRAGLSHARPRTQSREVLGPNVNPKVMSPCAVSLVMMAAYPRGGANASECASEMTRLKDGLLYMGSKDEMVPLANLRKLAAAVPVLTYEENLDITGKL